MAAADRTGAQYRAIVDVLLAQQQELLTGVGLDELGDLLAAHVREVGAGRTWDDRSLRPGRDSC